MILATGVDIVEIDRMEAVLKRHPRFPQRLFTEAECALVLSGANQVARIAAQFAGKEAVSKAFGTGIRGFSFKEIEILRDDLGRPVVHLQGNARRLADRLGILDINVSLSHSVRSAIAFAVAYGEVGR